MLLIILCTGCTSPEPEWIFVEITEEAGLGDFKHVNGAEGNWYLPETFGAGAVFFDYNNDNLIDLALVRGRSWTNSPTPAIRIYQGDGNGHFTDVTQETNLGTVSGYGMGLIAGDIDLDGDDDLYFTSLERNMLLVNDGNVFRDATDAHGLSVLSEWNVAALFLDANLDGWLDLYVTGYVNWTLDTDLVCTSDGTQKRYCTPELYTGTPGRFYLNRGDGTFTDHTEGSGLAGSGKTLGAVTMDINRDGWPDIVLANDTDPDQLFLNLQNGTFEDIGLARGMALDLRGRARAGMGIDAGIVDSTGEPTIFIGHFQDQMNGVYRYTPSGYFEERGPKSGIGPLSISALTFGLVLFDAELDGDLDLLAANGHINPQANEFSDISSYKQPAQLFINDGHGVFTDEAPSLGLTLPMVGRGAATADVDLDGDLDLLITENNGPVHLFRNDLPPGNNWLRIQLDGQAIDAVIEVWTGTLKQSRRVRAGHSYASQSEKVATFGLGSFQGADTVKVFWPNGQVTQRTDVAANQTLLFRETSR
ncbi:MAG: CRTAC1 family protein [Bacteroidetes bacterium]|nr:CRTAC1 family protein [Bacteroidota bacterium]